MGISANFSRDFIRLCQDNSVWSIGRGGGNCFQCKEVANGAGGETLDDK